MDGSDRADEEETRADPRAPRQLERMHMVFRATLMMCIAGQPQFAHIHITKAALDEWYDWFHEKTSQVVSPLPDRVLQIAERNAWRKIHDIHDLVHSGTSLSEAMSACPLGRAGTGGGHNWKSGEEVPNEI